MVSHRRCRAIGFSEVRSWGARILLLLSIPGGFWLAGWFLAVVVGGFW